MNSEFNDKHLLWWVLQVIRPLDLRDPDVWRGVELPEWVIPALREKYRIMQDEE